MKTLIEKLFKDKEAVIKNNKELEDLMQTKSACIKENAKEINDLQQYTHHTFVFTG